jgi:hypothetical protein
MATDQPTPHGTGPDIADLVCADIQARAALGERKYGERLRANNGRRGLQDLVEELYDACMYGRQCLEEQRLEEAMCRGEVQRQAARIKEMERAKDISAADMSLADKIMGPLTTELDRLRADNARLCERVAEQEATVTRLRSLLGKLVEAGQKSVRWGWGIRDRLSAADKEQWGADQRGLDAAVKEATDAK